jgi:hypothetical protein
MDRFTCCVPQMKITLLGLDCDLTITNLGATNGSMTPTGGLSYATNGSDITAKITMKGIHIIKDPVLTEGKKTSPARSC